MNKLLPLFVFLVLGNFVLSGWYEGQLAIERSGQAALLDVLGEARTVIARTLWFKMDLYHEQLDDEGLANEQQTEIMPLLRLVSLLDPSFVDAFDNIAWDLWKGHNQPEHALAILDEGLSNNPESSLLYFRKAMILNHLERFPEAVEPGSKALQYAQNDFATLDAGRVLYKASKKTGDQERQRQAILQLLKVRPGDKLWTSRLRALE